MRTQSLKIAIRRTTLTYLPCMSCGGFRTDYEVVADPNEPVVGVHRRCLEGLKVRRTRRPTPSREAATEPAAPSGQVPRPGP